MDERVAAYVEHCSGCPTCGDSDVKHYCEAGAKLVQPIKSDEDALRELLVFELDRDVYAKGMGTFTEGGRPISRDEAIECLLEGETIDVRDIDEA
jgi:hypothetical protein